ncbi:MAG: hypothetical protein C4538_05740 [Nitrospiraceae bacterium]|nr:MAG: hypothetical protein C4538_05740 [Nitrospiraceae bacterium]
MRDILQSDKDRGYPTEYLLARLMGRRTRFLKNWDDIIVSPEPLAILSQPPFGEFFARHSLDGAWKWALAEYGWVYRQMNAELRECFMPLFLYLELQTLIRCLRHKIRQTQEHTIKILLSNSLLSNRIKGIVTKETDVPAILKQFNRKIFHGLVTSVPLPDVYAKKGLGGLEQELTAGILKKIMSSKLRAVVRKFFIYLIDAKNIVAAQKRLRWNMPAESSFIRGGSVRESFLRSILRNSGLSGLHQFAVRKAGILPQGESYDSLEIILHAGLYKQVRIMAGDCSATGLLLHYLWSIYVQAHNLSIIQYGRGIDRDILRRELIIL